MAMKKVQLRSGAWFGDCLADFELPEGVNVSVVKGNPPEPMSRLKIKNRLRKPIGTKKLSELVMGKKKIVVIIDDIMRPTPTAEVLIEVVNELVSFGVDIKNIKVVVATGSHAKAKKEDMEKKVGKKLFREMVVLSHGDISDDLVFLGRTDLGTPVFVNKVVAEADLKISIGGIYPHPEAGFSGGAKIIAPGVCGLETIKYLHNVLTPASSQGEQESELREEIVNVAKKVGLDYSINLVLTPDRKIGAVFAGDVVGAYELGVTMVKSCYQINKVDDADVVISNSYPFDGSYYFFTRGYWPLYCASRRSEKILLVNGSMPRSLYGFKSLCQTRFQRVCQGLARFQTMVRLIFEFEKFLLCVRKVLFLRKPKFILFCTGDVCEDELKAQFPFARIYRDWKKLVRDVWGLSGGNKTKVVVYPYAGLQFVGDGV